MKTYFRAILLVLTVLGSPVLGRLPAMADEPAGQPRVGQPAPLVEGHDQNGRLWKLSDAFKKRSVLLYFYPKDDTPGCTKEACGHRDRLEEYRKKGVEVIGVSFDSAVSHKAFIEKHQLNFSLLADENGAIADAYGVRVEGKERAKRVSFLIGKDGMIKHVTDSSSAEIHLKEMGDAIAKLRE